MFEKTLIGGYHCGKRVELPYEHAIIYAVRSVNVYEISMREPPNSTKGIDYDAYRKAQSRDGRIVYIYEPIYARLTGL